jgi:hypothetical protein
MVRDYIQTLYDATIRNFLPRKIKVYNGVALRIGRLFDTTVVAPNYKQGTNDSLREYCKHDDHVVVIGGGLGVSAVVAAHEAQSVTAFEGGVEPAQQVRETANLNRVEDTVVVEEAIVADGNDIYGDEMSDTNVPPDELPDCDVLEMDCEGAEEPILDGMEIEPRVVIVESHPSFGVSPKTIRTQLDDRGYEVVDRFELESGNVTFTGIRE